MSKFSGKCDVYDVFCMIRDFDLDYIKKSSIYHGYEIEKNEDGSFNIVPGERIEIESKKDLVPYYPYIIEIGSYGVDSCTVYLSDKSWVDIAEERYGHQKIHDVYRQKLQQELAKYN